MATDAHDPFRARTQLEGAAEPTIYYRLAALEDAGIGHISRLPFSIKVLLEALLRQVDGFAVTEEDVRRLANWDAANPGPGRAAVQARARRDAGLHRRARRGGSGGDALGDGTAGRRSQAGQPADPGGPGDRPFGAGGSVRLAVRPLLQRRARVRAQPRALRVPEVGPAVVRQLPCCAAGDGHRASGEPGVSGECGADGGTKDAGRTTKMLRHWSLVIRPAAASPIPTPSSAPTATPP